MLLAPFSGPQLRLVLALDVGTTFSGIAYTILSPGEVPKVHNVTRFPGQEDGRFKIPSILWYTRDGEVHSVGAEARNLIMGMTDDDEDLVPVEWFKLFLRPEGLDISEIHQDDVKSLPLGFPVTNIFGDFLAYLFRCAKKFITETHPNGTDLWNSFGDRIEFILSHPNTWEMPQREKLTEAAIHAGFIADMEDQSRIHFVSEGVASLYYCIHHELASESIKNGSSVMVIDAGGGTINLSTYQFVNASPIAIQEVSSPECILQGSMTVNMRAREFLKKKLKDSCYGNNVDVNSMLDIFERHTKAKFDATSQRLYIKFGSSRDEDSASEIHRGQLSLDVTDVTRFFQPCLDGILGAISAQQATASTSIKTAFFVGGFAASPWLYERLRAALHATGMDLLRAYNHTNKAASEGAVVFFLTNSL